LIDPFKKSQIRNSGVFLSKLGFGGAPVSGISLSDGLYGGVNEGEALKIIDLAYTKGIRYFDTAPLYGTGQGETRYSKILSKKQKEGRKTNLKSGFISGIGYTGDEYIKFDLSRDGILKSLEESLQRLKLDYVDILLLHDPDIENLEEESVKTALPTMLQLRNEGVVKAIGCGMNQWEMPSRFIDDFDLDVVLLAGRFTLLDHSSFEKFLPKCIEKNVKIILGGPYNSGILAREILDNQSLFNYETASQVIIEKVRKIRIICKRYKIPLKAAALQYVMAHPAVISTIPGPETTEELLSNIKICKIKIPKEFWIDLIKNRLIPENAMYPKEDNLNYR